MCYDHAPIPKNLMRNLFEGFSFVTFLRWPFLADQNLTDYLYRGSERQKRDFFVELGVSAELKGFSRRLVAIHTELCLEFTFDPCAILRSAGPSAWPWPWPCPVALSWAIWYWWSCKWRSSRGGRVFSIAAMKSSSISWTSLNLGKAEQKMRIL